MATFAISSSPMTTVAMTAIMAMVIPIVACAVQLVAVLFSKQYFRQNTVPKYIVSRRYLIRVIPGVVGIATATVVIVIQAISPGRAAATIDKTITASVQAIIFAASAIAEK